MIRSAAVLFLYHDARVGMSMIVTYNKFESGFFNFDKPVCFI